MLLKRKTGGLLWDHKMLVCKPTKIQAVQALTTALDVSEKEFVIAVYGKSVLDAEKQEFRAFMAQTYPKVETYEIDGGQDVYDFMLIIE